MDAWHYTDAQIIARFERRFPGCRVIRLHAKRSGLWMDATMRRADGSTFTPRLSF